MHIFRTEFRTRAEFDSVTPTFLRAIRARWIDFLITRGWDFSDYGSK